MKLAIMQPYFFPYIGYFQLMNAVDEFVVYDNIEYTRKGWINRNRMLVQGAEAGFTVSLKKDSDYLNVVERSLADVWPEESKKLLNRLTEAYRKAPQFKEAFPLLKQCLESNETNLFRFVLYSLEQVRAYIGIKTPMVVSSTIPIDHTLRAEEKVLALCKARQASVYINSIGGMELYDKARFKSEGVELQFLKADEIQYTQFGGTFVPFLSIIDVMMFNPPERIREYLLQYTIL